MQATELYHPDYATAAALWEAIEDVCEGSAKVKSKKTTYLPKLSGEEDADYEARLRRAVLFNATKRTREALVGMLMRKPPKITIPEAAEPFTADIDLEGSTVKNWVRTVAQQVVSTGRGVTVIDWSVEETRPYLAFYPAVNVCNWAVERINGRNELSLLILKEVSHARVGSSVQLQEQFREYDLTPEGVQVRVWTVGERAEMSASEATPVLRNGRQLKRIPAVFHGATHLGPSIGEMPLGDIADLNLAHFMGSADLENGRHLCGIPTPYATGVDDDDGDLVLGSTSAWTASDPQARFGFIEFTGQGLNSLVTGQEEKERQMAVLGARLLFDNKKDAESYETVRLRSVSETASLANMAGYLSATLSQAIRWFVWWLQPTADDPAALGDDVAVLINDDFVDTPMEPTLLEKLTAALQSNSISFETYFHQLEQGEIYPPDWDLERETAAIAQRPPAVAPPKVDPPVNPDDDEEEEEEEEDDEPAE